MADGVVALVLALPLMAALTSTSDVIATPSALLREQLTWLTAVGGAAAILCAGLAVRARPDRSTS